MRKGMVHALLLCMVLCLFLTGCSATDATANDNRDAMSHILPYLANQFGNDSATTDADGTALRMSIGDTGMEVEWESNESVEALKRLCMDGPLTIKMSMYGGFEQVGPIGQSLPANDTQMTTQAGDIVLYSGNQIVVFYGPNSWPYTKLGHIAGKSGQELTQLLGNEDVTITLEQER